MSQLHEYDVQNGTSLLDVPLEDMDSSYITQIYRRLRTLRRFKYTGTDISTERKIVGYGRAR